MPKIKTIDVQAKEWFDRVNGNSYFAGTVTVNYQMPGEKVFVMPFQYGYGEQYLYEAANALFAAKLFPHGNEMGSITYYCREQGIILRHNIQTGCKKSELKAYEK